MKQELEKLGFKYKGGFYELWLNNFNYSIIITDIKQVSLVQDDDYVHLFEYDYEKLKQLIEILKN